MNIDRFDQIAARLAAHRMNRRVGLRTAGAGMLAASLGAVEGRITAAQDATPVAGDELPDTVLLGANPGVLHRILDIAAGAEHAA